MNDLRQDTAAQAWADIVVNRWLERMDHLKIHDSYELANSFIVEVVTQAQGDISRIEFAFNFYGLFRDMGVHRGLTLEEIAHTGRSDRRWYSPVFFAEVQKLGRILAEQYSRKGLLLIKEEIGERQII